MTTRIDVDTLTEALVPVVDRLVREAVEATIRERAARGEIIVVKDAAALALEHELDARYGLEDAP